MRHHSPLLEIAMLRLALLTILLGVFIPAQAQSSGAAQGYLDFQRQQQVRDCIKACGQDGQCQASCIAAGNAQPTPQQPPQYQTPPPRAPKTDFSCMSICTNAKYPYAQCQMQCTR